MNTKVLFFTFFLSVVLLIGCGEDPPDCSTVNCDDGNSCTRDSCSAGECSNSPILNCCGNNVCEKSEDGCSCETDCKSCSGKLQVIPPGYSEYFDAEFIELLCSKDKTPQCILGVPETKIITQPLTYDERFNYFTLRFRARFNRPFNPDTDDFTLDIEVLDMDLQNIFPDSAIVVTSVLLKEGDLEIASKNFETFTFENVGAKKFQKMQLKPAMPTRERSIYLTLEINYEYTEKRNAGNKENGDPIFTPNLIRTKHTITLGDIKFVRTANPTSDELKPKGD